LDDETEEKLWWMFIEGRVPEVDSEGNQRINDKGLPMYREISGISWNAFRQMVAYKRGMPAIAEPPKDSDAGRITVNFNVMGESSRGMNDRIREIQIPARLNP
jgi:hypothetical protein